MMKKTSKKVVIISFVSLFLISIPIVYAIYESVLKASDEVTVAYSYFVDTADDIPTMIPSLLPGESVSYTFTCKNFNGSKVSEVAFVYFIKLETMDLISFEFALYKNGNETVNLLDNKKTAMQLMNAKTAVTDTYKLVISLPEDIDYNQTGNVDYIDITVEAGQKIN